MRIIDADNLLIRLNNAFCAGYIGNGYGVAEQVVNEEPSVDLKTLWPTAKLIPVSEEYYRCSNCKALNGDSNYCVNCGARFIKNNG